MQPLLFPSFNSKSNLNPNHTNDYNSHLIYNPYYYHDSKSTSTLNTTKARLLLLAAKVKAKGRSRVKATKDPPPTALESALPLESLFPPASPFRLLDPTPTLPLPLTFLATPPSPGAVRGSATKAVCKLQRSSKWQRNNYTSRQVLQLPVVSISR